RRTRDRVTPLVGSPNAADIAIESRPVAGARARESEGALATMAREQCAAGPVTCLAFVLDREQHGAVGGNVEMPYALAMVGRPKAAEQASRGDLDVVERRAHRADVELLAGPGGMAADAADGNRERSAIGHQAQLVRTDAVGGHLANDAPVVGCPHDDHAMARLVVVLGRQQMGSIGGEGAMAVEM